MRGMKALVAVMSLLIFAGLGLVGYGMAVKAAAPRHGLADIVLPGNGTVRQMIPWRDSLALYVETPDGDYIYLYDPSAGVPEGRIAVRREK